MRDFKKLKIIFFYQNPTLLISLYDGSIFCGIEHFSVKGLHIREGIKYLSSWEAIIKRFMFSAKLFCDEDFLIFFKYNSNSWRSACIFKKLDFSIYFPLFLIEFDESSGC